MAIIPPTFVAEYESVWNNSIPPSVSTTTAPDQILAAYGGIHNGSAQLNLPTGGSLTWTQRQYRKPSNSYCTAYLWSAPTTTTATFNTGLTKVVTDSALMGINILRFSGSNGIGASANNSASNGAPTLSLTTTQNNSAIVMLVLDWNGTSGARTYRTTNAGSFTEQSYYQAGQWTVQGGYYANAGTAGAKTLGISAPSGQKYTIVAMEILGKEEVVEPPETTAVYRLSNGILLPMTIQMNI